jgi:hypothetical protein
MLRGKQGQLRSSATAGRNFDVVGPFQDYAVRACGHLEWVQTSLQEPPHSKRANV